MPISDLIYNADIAQKPEKIYKKGDENTMNKDIMENQVYKPEVGYSWIPVPPPMPTPFPPPPPPFPPFYPPYPIDPIKPDPDPEPEQGSASQQICKLSRKANVITKMLENLETKKKDVIIGVGGLSYNFGNIDLDLGEGWPDSSYAATVKTMLEYELGLIKTKIAELAEELGDEADGLNSGIEGTVGGQ